MLEFSAKSNGKELKGFDMICSDDKGKVVDFEVMVRPVSGLQALGDEMGKHLFLGAGGKNIQRSH